MLWHHLAKKFLNWLLRKRSGCENEAKTWARTAGEPGRHKQMRRWPPVAALKGLRRTLPR